jgi:hypothetical protein
MQHSQILSEDEFSEHQIKNSEKIVYMTCIQVVIVILIGLIQLFALKRIFRNKA